MKGCGRLPFLSCMGVLHAPSRCHNDWVHTADRQTDGRHTVGPHIKPLRCPLRGGVRRVLRCTRDVKQAGHELRIGLSKRAIDLFGRGRVWCAREPPCLSRVGDKTPRPSRPPPPEVSHMKISRGEKGTRHPKLRPVFSDILPHKAVSNYLLPLEIVVS
ncbi:hypothetical protein E2C01_006768 [Portunus trituberculatus]|uniref:Uncharacterized protein n=1 Tax=Portunus trituberculatus TaxID=210409 RepID=A0A5B7CY79_PORTR|nr:hypothetical protein [Portunus trituberculatus]